MWDTLALFVVCGFWWWLGYRYGLDRTATHAVRCLEEINAAIERQKKQQLERS